MLPTQNKSTTHSAVAAVLSLYAERGTISRKVVQIAADTSTSTARRWFEGTALPDAHEMRLLLMELPSIVADDLLHAWMGGLQYVFIRREGGVVDADPRTPAVRVMKFSLALMEDINRAMDDGRIDEGELAKVVSDANRVKRAVDRTARAARARRRK